MLSLAFLRVDVEEADSINKILDVFELCLTMLYLVLIAWVANRPAYRIYDQLINLLTSKCIIIFELLTFQAKQIAKNIPLFDINKFRMKQDRIEHKFDPQIEYLNEQLKRMKRTDTFQTGVTNEIFFFKLPFQESPDHSD